MRTPHRSMRRAVALLACAVTAAGLEVAASAPAFAGVIGVTAPTNTQMVVSTSTTLTGLAVQDTDGAETLSVTLSTSAGTVALSSYANLALGFGNNWSGDSSITFTGTRDNINTALATATVNPGASSGTAVIGLTAMASAPGYIYSPDNGHFYEYVASANITWSDARTAAGHRSFQGQAGYLATIPSAAVNSLITSKIPNAMNVWIGAESTDNSVGTPARAWTWVDGPLAGRVFSKCSNWLGACNFTPSTGYYANWANGEPNNSGAAGGDPAHSGEWVAVTNWGAYNGRWNDLPDDLVNAAGYVVEYGNLANGSSGFGSVASGSQTVNVVSVPGAPTGVSAVAGPGQATVSFSAPVSNGGSAITGYTVTSSPGSHTAHCAGSPCTVTVPAGLDYTFTVHATNAVGDSAESVASGSVTSQYQLATVPRNLTVVGHSQSADLSFDPPTFTEGLAVTAYRVSVDGGSTWVPLTTSGSSPITAHLVGLTHGTRYPVQVRALTQAGSGTPTASVDVTPATVPGTPRAVTATVTDSGVRVTWTAPENDGGAVINRYTVTASPGGVHCTTSEALTCLVTGLAAGHYTFSVVATNTDPAKPDTGNGPAATSDAVAVPDGQPGDSSCAVSGLRATAGDRSLSVSFQAPETGCEPTGYQVSLDGGRTWSSLSGRTTGGDVSGTVLGALNGQTYQVMVRATTTTGVGGADGPVQVRMPVWFADPVPSSQRAGQIPVPQNPTAFHGRLTWTKAAYRSHDGTAAIQAGSLRGRQLQAGQAVVLDGSLFAFDSARLTPAGMAEVRAAARGLRYVRSLTCEGYADYAGDPGHERQLSQARAAVICAALRSAGVRVSLHVMGYGPARPVLVGGRPADRAANRRVVLRITG